MFCRSLRLHRRRRQNIRQPNRRTVSVAAMARGEAQRSLDAVEDAGRARAAAGKVVANFLLLMETGKSHQVSQKMATRFAQLLLATNRLAEAEPLMRRALEIDEQGYGPEHPNVARDLNNLAQLLQATHRLAEAAPLMRRALVIFLKFSLATGHEHPHLRAGFGNYQSLLQALPTTAADTALRLDSLGAEAGWDADGWRAWLEQTAAGGA